MATRDQGIILRPTQHDFTVWCDADFAGNWDKDTAMDDPMTAKSRSGYAISYANCPIYWASKLQTEIALSTTESEYISLSQALRDTIPLMNLVDEVKRKYDEKIVSTPTVRCTLFEDNSGALELANAPKMRPRTKHINVKYHHFRDHVKKKKIRITSVRSEDQVADYLTKALPKETFERHRNAFQNW
jgi:hypothetical protein